MNQHVPTIHNASLVAAGEIMESVLTAGDIARLTHQERNRLYIETCRTLGLNPLTKPFEYLQLNGKTVFYATRACTDQLRQIHSVSVTSMTTEERDGILIVTAHVQDRAGRTDVGTGCVTLGALKGDALCNARMKAETKAKRRATLSICGLGWLDESEIETIPAAAKRKPPAEPPHDPVTGEVVEETKPNLSNRLDNSNAAAQPSSVTQDFFRLRESLRQIQTWASLCDWYDHNKDVTKGLPEDLKGEITKFFCQKRDNLRPAEAAE